MTCFRCGLTMLLILLGYFLLSSLTEGADMKTFTCSPGRLTATCDAGEVILIRQVRRGYYSGAFNGSHCKYQVGDSNEVDDTNSEDVWKNCNLQSTCSVPFIQSGNIYLEMDYECVASNMSRLDICDSGSGTRLVAKHGYIHSPCYPNLSTWNESTNAYCQCSGTFQFPVQAEVITLSVFHAFQETESLGIIWHTITNQPQTIRNTSPSFKMEQSASRSFYLKFSSIYQGYDWDRGFWLEFTANSPLEFKCSNTRPEQTEPFVKPPTCQTPPPPPTATLKSTTKHTTTTPTTTTKTTTRTTTVPASTTASSSGGSLPSVKTTISGTSSVITTAMTSEVVVGDHSQRDENIPAIVGLAVPLIIVSAILTSLIIISWRNNGIIARLCKGHSNENPNDIAQTNADCGPVYENVRKGYEKVSRSNFGNPAFVGDQNPRLTQSSDLANSSCVNVPANLTHSHSQLMPTYENIEHRSNPGVRNLDTDTRRLKAPAPSCEDYSPYEEMGDTGARMPGVGTAAASGEETESAYARLDPEERSEYQDLRHVGFAHQPPSK